MPDVSLTKKRKVKYGHGKKRNDESCFQYSIFMGHELMGRVSNTWHNFTATSVFSRDRRME